MIFFPKKSLKIIFILSSFLFIPNPLFSQTIESAVTSRIENENRIVIKAVEQITLISEKGNKKVKARIDTGATQSSIDENLARQLGFDTHLGKVNVISANGSKLRPIVEITYELSGKKIKSLFTVADRSQLNFPVLIGREDLKGFLIDPVDE